MHGNVGFGARRLGMSIGRAFPAGIPPGPPTITDQQMNPTDLTHEAIGAATTPGGFSFLELFMNASFVVKFVMTGLMLASIWSWAIIIEKLFAFRRARAEADRFEQHVLVGAVAG